MTYNTKVSRVIFTMDNVQNLIAYKKSAARVTTIYERFRVVWIYRFFPALC